MVKKFYISLAVATIGIFATGLAVVLNSYLQQNCLNNAKVNYTTDVGSLKSQYPASSGLSMTIGSPRYSFNMIRNTCAYEYAASISGVIATDIQEVMTQTLIKNGNTNELIARLNAGVETLGFLFKTDPNKATISINNAVIQGNKFQGNHDSTAQGMKPQGDDPTKKFEDFEKFIFGSPYAP